jgi:Immunity protein 26
MNRTNIKVQKPSRRKPASGDIFALQLPDDRHLFGRVIYTDLSVDRAPMPGSYLIQIYDQISRAKKPESGEAHAGSSLASAFIHQLHALDERLLRNDRYSAPASQRRAQAILFPQVDWRVPR